MDSRTVLLFSVGIIFQLSIRLNAESVENEPIITKRVIGNSTFFVRTRTAVDGKVEEEACKCDLFVIDCADENIFQIPDNPYPCGDENEVCCRVETPLPPGSDTTEGTSRKPTTSSSATRDSTTPDSTACKCALRSECEIEDDLLRGLDPKSFRVGCDSDAEVCCLKRKSKFKCGERKGHLDLKLLTSPKNSSLTDFGEFPFMGSVWTSGDEFLCGASLIVSNMVLTAAHCVMGKNSSTLRVRVRDYNIRAQTLEERFSYQEKSVALVIIHDGFNMRTLSNDLALLVATDAFELDFFTYPVCTIAFGSEFVDSKLYNSSECRALGWGKSSMTNSLETLSDTLKQVKLKLVPSTQCQEKLRKTSRLGPYYDLHSSFLCAEGLNGLDETCKGDGGGPLVCPLHTDRHRFVQVGVTSAGVGCGNNVPGLYASLEANNDWISSNCKMYRSSPSE